MVKKLRFLNKVFVLVVSAWLFLTGYVTSAQCAGTNNSITVCDILDPSSKSIDLFNGLLGSPVTGGIWKDNQLSGGLNPVTGILNVQNIKKSGDYTYTYSVDNGNGCKASSVVTVTVGGYAGVSSPNVSACSDDLSFNLFQGFNGNFLSPQSNGTWTDNNGTGALNGNFLNAKSAGVGTYSFTYTMPAIGGCDAQFSTVNVTIFRAPEPGVGSVLLLCSSDRASFSTNFDLNNLLAGQDAGGIWSEGSGTAEISSLEDSFVDIKNIYDNFGSGVFSFTYSVDPDNPICTIKKSAVSIIIEDQIDLTGAKLIVNSDICENEIQNAQYTAVLSEGTKSIPNGSYKVTYAITGGSVNTRQTATANFTNGSFSFPISSTYFQQVGSFKIEVVDIVGANSLGACNPIISDVNDFLNIFPIPKIDNSQLIIDSVCKGSDATVVLSGSNNLSDGTYELVYRLSGSNTVISQKGILSVVNGIGRIIIPANSIPNEGTTIIAISAITNLSTRCTNVVNLSKDFTIKALPNVSALSFTVANACQGQPIVVTLAGLGSLSTAAIKYDLSGANNAVGQSVSLAVSNGSARFEIPSVLLRMSGNNTLSLKELSDGITSCIVVLSNINKNFTINAIPSVPLTRDVVFCLNDSKKVSDLTPSGSQYQWFTSATSLVVLSPATILVSGAYYVKEVNSATGCESPRAMAVVTINQERTPVLDSEGELFCGLDNPTLSDLSSKVSSDGSLTWYDAEQNGNLLESNILLVDNRTYYGFSSSNSTTCKSSALAVTVSLSNCIETAEFFIPDGFSPNGDGINDTFRIPDIDFIYPNYSLQIYNRYGTLMFTGNKSNPGWDGRNSSFNIGIDGIAPNGVYFYIINFNKDQKSSQQGSLYLNR